MQDVRSAGRAGRAARASLDRLHVYVLEVNPRASRTVPFVAKATGMPVAKIAAKVMAGVSLAEQGVTEDPVPSHVSVKEAVFPFIKFCGRRHRARPRDAIDRRSDGHQRPVLDGVRQEPARGRHRVAAARATSSSASPIGTKRRPSNSPASWSALGFSLLATSGTADALEAAGIPLPPTEEAREGQPNLLDYFADRDVALVVNTPSGKGRPHRRRQDPRRRRASRRAVRHHARSRDRRRESDRSAARRRDASAGAAGSIQLVSRRPRPVVGDFCQLGYNPT